VVVAAVVVNDGDFVMEDVVFIVCDFLKLEIPSSPQKKNFFYILQEKIFLTLLQEKIFCATVRKDLFCQ
jgi:hypothetical protein